MRGLSSYTGFEGGGCWGKDLGKGNLQGQYSRTLLNQSPKFPTREEPRFTKNPLGAEGETLSFEMQPCRPHGRLLSERHATTNSGQSEHQLSHCMALHRSVGVQERSALQFALARKWFPATNLTR